MLSSVSSISIDSSPNTHVKLQLWHFPPVNRRHPQLSRCPADDAPVVKWQSEEAIPTFSAKQSGQRVACQLINRWLCTQLKDGAGRAATRRVSADQEPRTLGPQCQSLATVSD